MPTATLPTIRQHFDGRAPQVRGIYDRILRSSRRLGPVREEAKKTSIHLVRKTAFAGVSTRKDALILTIKSSADIRSPRITKREQASANRWHLEIRLMNAAEVDGQVEDWIEAAYELAG
jgi:hypothetical protein